MTTEEALAQLRPDWHLSRGDNYRTDEPGWSVGYAPNGEVLEEIGWGTTVAEAIEAAALRVEREEREQVEQIADYARRQAAGELTPEDHAREMFGVGWVAQIKDDVQTLGILSGVVDQSFEAEIAGDGTAICIPQRRVDAS